MSCTMLVKVSQEHSENPVLKTLREINDVSDSTRTSWVNGMKESVEKGPENEGVRPLNFVFLMDGSVEVESSNLASPVTYLSPYCIPPETIADLEPSEKIRRAELFALGSMIYEINTGEPPFEGLVDSDIQARYRRAEYPEVTNLPHWPIILSCWSVEFAGELYALLAHRAEENIFERFGREAGRYVQGHPVLFGIQCLSMAAGITAAVAVPVLGAIGFGALGPLAGSSAAVWQASIGAVEAGSLFAWCQSVAMGGAAMSGVIAAGAAGGGGLVLSSAAAMVEMNQLGDAEMKETLTKLFADKCRKA